ncbi:MAG: synthase subunit b [Acidimicrobiaceae bacterium]|jgi:F-type H+-transporting ATPase subunit b|nr:synthase subunit b [Acidimicrobiaceae bacterium]
MLYASTNFGESYILEVVGTLLVVVFIVRKVVPPLRKAMDRQAEAIRAQLAAGDEARKAAERLVAARKAELERARSEAAALLEQAKVTSAQLVADGERRSNEEYERLVARAATEVELRRARAREEVTARVAALVVAAAEAVVEAELDAELHHHLIVEAIAAAESEAR